MPRGDFKAMLGMSNRGATDALGALVKRGLLKSDSPQGKVRWGLPQHVLRCMSHSEGQRRRRIQPMFEGLIGC